MTIYVRLGLKGTPFVVDCDSIKDYTRRVMAVLAGVELDDLESGDLTAAEMVHISEAADLLEGVPIFVGRETGPRDAFTAARDGRFDA